MRNILVRTFLFFLHSIGLIALLPLVAKGLQANATTYTLLLASMGVGAIPSLGAMRTIIAASVEIENFAPQDTAAWDAFAG